jgi:MFS family permease
MLLGSAALSSASALVCIWAEAFGQWSQVWACGTVFLLATIAGQAVFTAAISWISVAAAESHRATLIGFSSALVAVESAIVGAVLGGIAQQHGTSWPVVTLLALNLIAVGVAMGSPTRAQVSAVQDEREHVDSPARAESDRELLAA